MPWRVDLRCGLAGIRHPTKRRLAPLVYLRLLYGAATQHMRRWTGQVQRPIPDEEQPPYTIMNPPAMLVRYVISSTVKRAALPDPPVLSTGEPWSLVTAFMSVSWWPNNPRHVLVIPDRHVENVYDLPPTFGTPLQEAIRAIALAMKATYECTGTRRVSTTSQTCSTRGTIMCMSFPGTRTMTSTCIPVLGARQKSFCHMRSSYDSSYPTLRMKRGNALEVRVPMRLRSS